MAKTYNTSTGYNAVDIDDRSTTIGAGSVINADGTLGAPGTGNYVEKSHLITEVFMNLNLDDMFGFRLYTPFLNLIKSSYVSDFLGRTGIGQMTTFRWESPMKVTKGSSVTDCYAKINKVYAEAKTVHADDKLQVAESMEDCKCPPKDCGGRDDVFFMPTVQMKRARAEKALARELEAEIVALIKAKTQTALPSEYNDVTRYRQTLKGLAYLRNNYLKAGLDADAKNFIILATPLTISEYQLEDAERYRFNYDKQAFESLLNSGLAGFIQGVPVLPVSSDVVDETTGWMTTSLTFYGAAVKCDKEIVDKIQKGNVTGDYISWETGYARTLWYGIADLSDVMAEALAPTLGVKASDINLAGVKGIALKVPATTTGSVK